VPQSRVLCSCVEQVLTLPRDGHSVSETNALGGRVASCMNCAHGLVERQARCLAPEDSLWRGAPPTCISIHRALAWTVHLTPGPPPSPPLTTPAGCGWLAPCAACPVLLHWAHTTASTASGPDAALFPEMQFRAAAVQRSPAPALARSAAAGRTAIQLVAQPVRACSHARLVAACVRRAKAAAAAPSPLPSHLRQGQRLLAASSQRHGSRPVGRRLPAVHAMVNVDVSPSVILGVGLIGAGVSLWQIRRWARCGQPGMPCWPAASRAVHLQPTHSMPFCLCTALCWHPCPLNCLLRTASLRSFTSSPAAAATPALLPTLPACPQGEALDQQGLRRGGVMHQLAGGRHTYLPGKTRLVQGKMLTGSMPAGLRLLSAVACLH
jgi:hypothetical protein